MALEWLKSDRRLKVNNTEQDRTVVVKDTPKPSYKLKVTNTNKRNPEIVVSRTNERGQLLRAMARAGQVGDTKDTVKLTGLTEREKRQRQARAYKARVEKEIEQERQEWSGLSLFGKIINELPRAATKTLKGTAELGLDIARDTARAPLAVAAEGVKIGARGLESIGVPQAKTDDFKFVTAGNPITEFVFGKEDISGFRKEGERFGISGDAALPVGILATGAEFIPGAGKAGKKIVRLADDVIASTDDMVQAAESAAKVFDAEKTVRRSREAVDAILQRPKITRAEKITQALDAAQEQGHRVERIVQTTVRGGRAVDDINVKEARKFTPPREDYLNVEAARTSKDIVGGTPGKADFKFPKSVPTIQKPLISTTGKISRFGEPGAELATRIRLARDISDQIAGDWTSQLRTVSGLRRGDWKQFYEAVDTLAKGEKLKFTPSPNVVRALDEWKKFTPKAREAAINVGLDPGDLGQWYFPKSYRKQLASKKGREAAVNHLLDTRQVQNLEEALQVVGRFRAMYDGTADNILGNLKYSRRYDLPNPDTGRDVIGNYIEGVASTVGKTQYLGPSDEIALELVGQTQKLGYSVDDAADLLQTYYTSIGKAPETGTEAFKKFSRAARQFQAFIRLGAAAIANAGQVTNSASVAGIWRQAKGALKGLSPAQRREVERMGVISDQILTALREGHGFGRTAAGRVAAPFFQEIERFNRVSTAIAGADWAKSLARKGDEKSLRILREKLNVTGPISKQLTDIQVGEAARSMVNLTQFRVDPQDLPGWAASPGGKLVAQFRTFSYKQSGFLWNEVIKEAGRGNVKPMARFLAMGIPVGIITGSVRDIVKGRPAEVPDTPAGIASEGLQNVGAYGLAGDVSFLWQTRRSANFPQYGAGIVGGPSAGFLVETITNIGRAAQGQPESLQRQAVKAIPAVGPALQRSLLPTNFQLQGGNTEEKSGSGGRTSRRTSDKKKTKSPGSGGRKSRRE